MTVKLIKPPTQDGTPNRPKPAKARFIKLKLLNSNTKPFQALPASEPNTPSMPQSPCEDVTEVCSDVIELSSCEYLSKVELNALTLSSDINELSAFLSSAIMVVPESMINVKTIIDRIYVDGLMVPSIPIKTSP